MRLLLERDNGSMVEIEAIESVHPQDDMLLFFCSVLLTREAKSQLEEELRVRTGRLCVILPPGIEKVAGIKQKVTGGS